MLLRISKPVDKERVIDYVRKLSSEKKYIVDIKVWRQKRSLDQNSLYWLWLSCIMHETGNSKEVLHEFFKSNILDKKKYHLFDEKYSVELTTSTSTLNTKEMNDFLKRVQEFANSELGIVLPNPEDLYFDLFLEQYKNFI